MKKISDIYIGSICGENYTPDEITILKLSAISRSGLDCPGTRKIYINIAEYTTLISAKNEFLTSNFINFIPFTDKDLIAKGHYGILNGCDVYCSKEIEPGHYATENPTVETITLHSYFNNQLEIINKETDITLILENGHCIRGRIIAMRNDYVVMNTFITRKHYIKISSIVGYYSGDDENK